jgi:uncharacterized membrane protein SpoIIM required for sporulation
VISSAWLEKRQPHWTRLETLVTRTGHNSVAALTAKELQELAVLYRQVASDLATVREDPSSLQLALYLNQLLGRAHNLIYMGRRPEPRDILGFYRRTFPAIFRASFTYSFAALVIFFAAAAAGFLACLADPGFQRYLLGSRMVETIERHEMWTQSILTIKPLASSTILTNNITVALTTFALGITGGIGTLWMLVLNGMLLGVVSGACWESGMSLAFWSFVAPHGVLELPAIFIAGGAGLILGRAILFPGWLTRRAALVAAGSEAVRLVLGAIPLLVVAGIVEAFVSPTPLPAALKFTLAALLGAALALYLTSKTPAQGPGAPEALPTHGSFARPYNKLRSLISK